MGMFTRNYCFTAKDICAIHKAWLGDVYEWAGRYRQVNVSKDNFSFAMSQHIPKLMQEFEKGLVEALHAVPIQNR
jgi:cell filamentation protein